MNAEPQIHETKHNAIIKENNLQESLMSENNSEQNNKRFEEIGVTK